MRKLLSMSNVQNKNVKNKEAFRRLTRHDCAPSSQVRRQRCTAPGLEPYNHRPSGEHGSAANLQDRGIWIARAVLTASVDRYATV